MKCPINPNPQSAILLLGRQSTQGGERNAQIETFKFKTDKYFIPSCWPTYLLEVKGDFYQNFVAILDQTVDWVRTGEQVRLF